MSLTGCIECPYCRARADLLISEGGLWINETSDPSAYYVQVPLDDYFVYTCQTCGLPVVGKISLCTQFHKVNGVADRGDE